MKAGLEFLCLTVLSSTVFHILDCCDRLCSFPKEMIRDIGWNYKEISKVQNYNTWVDESLFSILKAVEK